MEDRLSVKIEYLDQVIKGLLLSGYTVKVFIDDYQTSLYEKGLEGYATIEVAKLEIDGTYFQKVVEE